MLIKSLGKQLIHDLRANWQKSALLGVLLLVGLYFWIPPLLSAGSGGAPAQVAAPDEQLPTPSAPIRATAAPLPALADATPPEADERIGWREGLALLESDPLVRSAEIAAMVSQPFQIDRDQFPPPLLFAADEKESETGVSPGGDPAQPVTAPTGLTLKSTIIGVNRRAAMLNGRLHFQGNSVISDDATYTLLEIHNDHVILSDGSAEFVLEIPRRKFSRKINVQ